MFTDGLTYRDSHMASEKEFCADLSPFYMNDNTGQCRGGPVLYRKGLMVYTDPSDAHDLIIGDTGSMKTLRFVLPLIYSTARAGESMTVVDPKGELYRKSAGFLEQMGYKIHALDFRNPRKSRDRWNPMERVQNAKCDVDSSQELHDLFQELFFNRSSADKDKYWNESAGQFGMGICKLILSLGEKLNLKNMLTWRYENMPNGMLGELFENLPTSNEAYQDLAGVMALKAENTKSCILSTFDQLVRVFKATPALTEMLTTSTFSLESLGTEKTAIFLIVPDEKTTFHFLATLFINQCYTALVEKAEQYDGRLPVRVNFILEEFCNMPKLTSLVPMLTAARSRNIRFHLVVQSYGQMVDKYTESVTKVILDNCGNLIYLHSREMAFLRYISELAGNNEYDRPLISTSRLQRLSKNETLIFHDRCYPFLAQDIPLIFEYPVELEQTQMHQLEPGKESTANLLRRRIS